MRDVVALVGESVAAFELGVVAEVFGLDRTADGLPGFDFALAAQHPGPRVTTSGFPVVVENGLDRLRTADLVAVPSWGVMDDVPDEVSEALWACVDRGATVLAVCSGTFGVAGTGLLDGRRAATHWRFADLLAERFPRVRVDADVLYVDEGQIVTSAGTSAGIDACLHLVRRSFGAATANAIARRMVVPPHRDGGQAQYIETPVPITPGGPPMAQLIEWLEGRLDEPVTVADLAARVHMSPRSFARWFRAAAGTTPHRWLLDQRLRMAETLLETTDLGIETIARRTGMGTADGLRHHFGARRGISPSMYRRVFRRPAVEGADRVLAPAG